MNTVKQTLNQTDVVQLMLTAQPYAHAAYTNVTAAGASVTPAITAAMDPLRPYLEPLMQRALEARAALIAHAAMGPYIAYALDRLHAAIELARLYCSIGDPSAAVLSALTGVPQDALPDLPDMPDLSEVPEISDVAAKVKDIASHVPFAPGAPDTTQDAPQVLQEVQKIGENVSEDVQSEVKNLPEEVKEGVPEAAKGLVDEVNEQVKGVVEEPQETNDAAGMDALMKHLDQARRALNVVSPRGKSKK